MTPVQIRQNLKVILEWMAKHNQNYIDTDFISHGVWPNPKNPDDEKGVRIAFPVPLRTYQEFHKALGQEFTEQYYEAYQDRGYGEFYKNDADGQEWRFPENRMFFNFNGTKFIWRWMTGQGDAFQLIKAGTFERATYDESKEIVINEQICTTNGERGVGKAT